MLFRLLCVAACLAVLPVPAALAQNLPPQRHARTLGLTPQYIICMETKKDGRPAQLSRTPWEGGDIPADACPPGSGLFQAYILNAWPGIAPSTETSPEESGGNH